MFDRSYLAKKEKIVVKIGSSSLTHPETGHISIFKLEKLVRQLADLKHSGKDVILVSSGAQAVGVSALNLCEKPSEIAKKQATASVGQASLMMIYHKLFREYNIVPGQVLITKDILDHPKRRQNAINTFEALITYGVIPIVNENDTVATDEIVVGDNDTLSAVVAEIVDADLLIILSDIDGLYDKNPTESEDAELLDYVEKVDEDILKMASGSSTRVGTGGMITKLQAATIATSHGVDMIIANADREHVLHQILEGASIGTLFVASKE